jgi:RNA polymerase sigma-70 factor (ECF subfamily)
MDVRHILSGLPEHTQRLCERLMIDSLAEVARQMQIPRTTLRGHILLLRNVFATALEQNRKKVSSLHRDLQ